MGHPSRRDGGSERVLREQFVCAELLRLTGPVGAGRRNGAVVPVPVLKLQEFCANAPFGGRARTDDRTARPPRGGRAVPVGRDYCTSSSTQSKVFVTAFFQLR